MNIKNIAQILNITEPECAWLFEDLAWTQDALNQDSIRQLAALMQGMALSRQEVNHLLQNDPNHVVLYAVYPPGFTHKRQMSQLLRAPHLFTQNISMEGWQAFKQWKYCIFVSDYGARACSAALFFRQKGCLNAFFMRPTSPDDLLGQ